VHAHVRLSPQQSAQERSTSFRQARLHDRLVQRLPSAAHVGREASRSAQHRPGWRFARDPARSRRSAHRDRAIAPTRSTLCAERIVAPDSSIFIASGEPPPCRLITEYQPAWIRRRQVLDETGPLRMRFSYGIVGVARGHTSDSRPPLAGCGLWVGGVRARQRNDHSAGDFPCASRIAMS
jgi:hypothetical protein